MQVTGTAGQASSGTPNFNLDTALEAKEQKRPSMAETLLFPKQSPLVFDPRDSPPLRGEKSDQQQPQQGRRSECDWGMFHQKRNQEKENDTFQQSPGEDGPRAKKPHQLQGDICIQFIRPGLLVRDFFPPLGNDQRGDDQAREKCTPAKDQGQERYRRESPWPGFAEGDKNRDGGEEGAAGRQGKNDNLQYPQRRLHLILPGVDGHKKTLGDVLD
jgi:hypothetical protein